MTEPIRVMFEGQLRTVAEIKAMIPAVANNTIRRWIASGDMPATVIEAVSRPKKKHRPTAEHKRMFKGFK